MKIETLHTINTEQPADALEWCTHPDFQHYFICGTYQLEEGERDFTQAPSSMYGVCEACEFCRKFGLVQVRLFYLYFYIYRTHRSNISIQIRYLFG